MAGHLRIAALSLSAAALAAGLATACSAEERKPYAEKDDVQPRTSLSPCSARLAVIRAPRLATSGPAEDVVEDAFDAERLIGVEENVEVRSEEHTSELQSLMRISYAVFCLKKKTIESNN